MSRMSLTVFTGDGRKAMCQGSTSDPAKALDLLLMALPKAELEYLASGADGAIYYEQIADDPRRIEVRYASKGAPHDLGYVVVGRGKPETVLDAMRAALASYEAGGEDAEVNNPPEGLL